MRITRVGNGSCENDHHWIEEDVPPREGPRSPMFCLICGAFLEWDYVEIDFAFVPQRTETELEAIFTSLLIVMQSMAKP